MSKTNSDQIMPGRFIGDCLDKLVSKIEPVAIEYTVGEWLKARTIEQMQQFYLHRLPAIREAAREHGYAIGVHGSQRRDFDLMAMQWREDAADPDTLAHAIAEAACGLSREGAYQWEKKPMGRISVSIPICWTDHANPDFKELLSVGHIDLSVLGVQQAVAEATASAVERVTDLWEQSEGNEPYLIDVCKAIERSSDGKD